MRGKSLNEASPESPECHSIIHRKHDLCSAKKNERLGTLPAPPQLGRRESRGR